CGIAPEDDDGNAASKTPTNKPAPIQTPQMLSAEQVATVTALADEVKANIPKLCEYYGATSIETIQAGHYSHIIKTLEAKRKSA
ncbi:hypothetical protein P0Q15_09090, partial [Campylobacter jejuni]|uniref:hypothetical protein n=1 Tax=Campylobacter jejuni TaxID=197 RepID=UPI002F9692E6